VSNLYPAVTEFFLLGKTLKSHGTSGQIRLLVENKLKPYIRPGEYLFLDLQGSKVPYKIEAVNEEVHFVIELEDIHGKEESDALTNKEIWIPLDKVKAIHKLAPRRLQDEWRNYMILDKATRKMHAILRTEEFPQQLMAVIEWNGKEYFIPLAEQLITSIDRKEKIVYMDLPEGILDL
jgi:16S rRNA processing protein RimM